MLSDYQKVQLAIGAAKRLHVPMGDRFLWREAADLIRGLATNLDNFSRLRETPDMDEYQMHLRIMHEIDAINRTLRKTARQAGIDIQDGRRPAAEQHSNEAGTVGSDRRWEPQVVDYQHKQR